MKLLMRGNKQLRVEDDRAETMAKLGYREVDPKSGKYIEKDEPKDEGKDSTVKKENAELKKRVAKLEKENAELKKQIAQLTEKLTAAQNPPVGSASTE